MTRNQIKVIIIGVAFALIIALTAGLIVQLTKTPDKPTTDDTQQVKLDGKVYGDNGNAMDEGVIYDMPKTMSFTPAALAAATNGVSVQIQAYVYPVTAANKQVDYSVDWGTAPSHGKESVTDYLTVTPDSDGSTVATVTCKKAFGNDKILITVTTREGDYTSTCTASFVGTVSGISITSSTAPLSNSTTRGKYYSLATSKTYTFNINLSNSFGSVGTSNLNVTLGGVGSLYFGTCTYNDGGYPNYTDMKLRTMSEMVNGFITSATISGTTLTVKTGALDMFLYYSSYGTDEFYNAMYYYDHFVVEYDDWLNPKTDPSANFYNSKAKENIQSMPSCYFTLTVTDKVSGVSETIRLWLDGVTGVSLDKSLSF